MEKDRWRDEFNQAFYRSLEDGGIEIKAVPAAQLQALSRACADGLFAALQAAHQDEGAQAPTPRGDEEQLVWEGGSWLTLGIRYELTSQRLRIHKGIFSRSLIEIDLIHVREARFSQHLGERMVNIGDVVLVTAAPDYPEVRLENVKDPTAVRELIRTTYLAEQKRRGLVYREVT